MHLWIPKRHTIIVVPRPLMRRDDPLVRRNVLHRLERPESAASFVASSSAEDQTGSTFPIDKPPGAADGDRLVAFQWTTLGGGTTPATPTGWTLIDTRSFGSAVYELAAYKKQVSGDGSTYTFNGPGGSPLGNTSNVRIGCWSGAGDPTQSSKNTGTSTTLRALSITTTDANSYLFAAFAIAEGLQNVSVPGGWTGQGQLGTGVVRGNTGYVLQAAAGASGNKDGSTAPNPANYGTMMVVVPPAAAAATGSGGCMAGKFGPGAAFGL
jgi:hypothetical protein